MNNQITAVVEHIPYAAVRLSARIAAVDSSSGAWMIFLNGAGVGLSKDRFLPFHEAFTTAGVNSLSFDYVGIGETGGNMSDSSLADRVAQVLSVLDWIERTYGPITKLGLYGVSMGCYVALGVDNELRNSGTHAPDKLMLVVGAAYAAASHGVSFGPAFTEILRSQPNGQPSWTDSPSFQWLAESGADVLLVVAENDEIVPRAISDQYQKIGEARPTGKFIYHLIPGATHYIGRTGREFSLAPKLVNFYQS
jgi:dienelactone hydrolase